MLGELIAAGGSLLSGWLNNAAADARQEDAQAFNAEQFATRYQTTVKDMQAAGLNPMLAYSQGGGVAPSSSPASSAGYGDVGASITQAKLASAQVANIAADTENKKAQADLIEAQAMEARSSAYQKNDMSNLAQMQVKEIQQKLENQYYTSDVERIRAVAKELQSQYDLNIEKGKSEQQSRMLMLMQAHKLNAETDLLHLDKDAADKFGNMGRQAGQAKPVFDILNAIIRAGKGK